MAGFAPGDASLSAPAMAYTDIRALSEQPTTGAQGLEQAAQQFESLFIDWVLKSMREANQVLSEGSYLSSSEVQMHEEMLDHQMALHLSNNGGLGLRALIMDQLSGGVQQAQETAPAADTPVEQVQPGAGRE